MDQKSELKTRFTPAIVEQSTQKPKVRPTVTQKRRELLDTDEAAAYLGIKPSTLRTWRCTKAVDLRYAKIGSAVRYRREDLQSFIDANLTGGDQ